MYNDYLCTYPGPQNRIFGPGTELNSGPVHFSNIYWSNFEVIIYIMNAGPQYHGFSWPHPPCGGPAYKFIRHNSYTIVSAVRDDRDVARRWIYTSLVAHTSISNICGVAEERWWSSGLLEIAHTIISENINTLDSIVIFLSLTTFIWWR